MSADRLTEQASLIKNQDEIICLAHACSVAGIGMARMRGALRPGITELELISQANVAYGGEWLGYKLLASGGHINPQGDDATDRIIQAGELVAFDCGLIGPFNYSADVSRTFYCGPGRLGPTQKKLYALAVENIEHNLNLVKAGVSCEEFSWACWPIPDEFVKHRYPVMAHGIGMGDEVPAIPWPVDWNDESVEGQFEENMVILIESFIGSEYGGEGVKLEQQVVATENGYDLLSPFPWTPIFGTDDPAAAQPEDVMPAR